MKSNRIGMVMVQERGRLVGTVTDRDLALRVCSAGLDPARLVLKDVMTPDPCTLPIDATAEQALELMHDRHIRRVPLLEGQQVVGLVSIDDLILDGTASLDAVSEVIQAQLAEPAELKPAGAVHPTKPATARMGGGSDRLRRRAARMHQTAHQAARKVRAATGLEDSETALTALEVVVADIVRRLTPSEAHDLLAQLPNELKERLPPLPQRPDENLTRESIEMNLAHRLDIDPETAPALLDGLGSALEAIVSPGEIDHVRAQLPRDMKSIFP